MSEKLKGSELSFSRVSILHIDLSRLSFSQSTWILQNDETIGTILGFVQEDISLPGKVNLSKKTGFRHTFIIGQQDQGLGEVLHDHLSINHNIWELVLTCVSGCQSMFQTQTLSPNSDLCN